MLDLEAKGDRAARLVEQHEPGRGCSARRSYHCPAVDHRITSWLECQPRPEQMLAERTVRGELVSTCKFPVRRSLQQIREPISIPWSLKVAVLADFCRFRARFPVERNTESRREDQGRNHGLAAN
jgi:hypothetical protein